MPQGPNIQWDEKPDAQAISGIQWDKPAAAAPPPTMRAGAPPSMMSKVAGAHIPGTGVNDSGDPLTVGEIGGRAKELGEAAGSEAMMLMPEIGAPGMAGKIITKGAAGAAGAVPGAYFGGKMGKDIGDTFGMGGAGKVAGTLIGGVGGAYAGAKTGDIMGRIGGGFENFMNKYFPKAAETGIDASGVAKVPGERTMFPGENPNYMASVKREELPGMAQAGKPGAAKQLQQLGTPVIETVPEGYPGPRPGSKMVIGEKVPMMGAGNEFTASSNADLDKLAAKSGDVDLEYAKTRISQLKDALKAGVPESEKAGLQKQLNYWQGQGASERRLATR